MLLDATICSKMLEVIERYCNMLQDAERCWKILQDAARFSKIYTTSRVINILQENARLFKILQDFAFEIKNQYDFTPNNFKIDHKPFMSWLRNKRFKVITRTVFQSLYSLGNFCILEVISKLGCTITPGHW